MNPTKSGHAWGRRQGGAAILLALVIAGIAAAIAIGVLWPQQLWLKQNEFGTARTQASTLAVAGIDWARAVLRDDARTSGIDHLREHWAIRLPPTPLENGEIEGYLIDAQGLFNLNSMVLGNDDRPEWIAAGQRLYAATGVPAALLPPLLDWVDRDRQPRAGGAEDEAYLGARPAYRPPNQPLAQLEELALVQGYTSAVVAQLSPLVSVLPEPTPVNVNTAPPEVLQAVIPGLKPDEARSLVAERNKRPFQSNADFASRLPRPDLTIPNDAITVASRYFLVVVMARQFEPTATTPTVSRVVASALLKRDRDPLPTVVWRSIQ